jgi:hypothetical protein
VKDKSEKLITPKAAFVTFKTSLGYRTALKHMGAHKVFGFFIPATRHEICGEYVRVIKAPEPSDVRWENYSISWKRKLLNNILVHIGIICTIFIFFILFTFLKLRAQIFSLYFPPFVNCM